MTPALTMRALVDTPADRGAATTVFLGSPDYHLTVEGALANDKTVDDFFNSTPPGFALDALFPLGFFALDDLVGLASVLRGWNAPNKAIIGLLLFPPAQRGKGFGRQAVTLIECLARSWSGIDRLRIGIVTTNTAAFPFWAAAGFSPNGEVKPGAGHYTGDIIIYEKPLFASNAEAS